MADEDLAAPVRQSDDEVGEWDPARAGPVTPEDVQQAVRRLEAMGKTATRRLVREFLGRGSITTIHNAMRELEARRVPDLPEIDLGEADKHLALELVGRLLGVVRDSVAQVTAERETALQTAAKLAEERAADAIAAAESDIVDALRREREASAGRERAEASANSAMAEAAAARQETLKLSGQVDLLTEDRNEALARLGVCEEKLARAIAQYEGEIELRTKAEELNARLEQQLAAARSELETVKLELGRANSDLAEKSASLAETSAKLADAAVRLESARENAVALQVELAGVRSRLSIAEDQVAERDRQIDALQAGLSTEKGRAEGLEKALEESRRHGDVLLSIRAAIEAASAQAATQRAEPIARPK